MQRASVSSLTPALHLPGLRETVSSVNLSTNEHGTTSTSESGILVASASRRRCHPQSSTNFVFFTNSESSRMEHESDFFITVRRKRQRGYQQLRSYAERARALTRKRCLYLTKGVFCRTKYSPRKFSPRMLAWKETPCLGVCHRDRLGSSRRQASRNSVFDSAYPRPISCFETAAAAAATTAAATDTPRPRGLQHRNFKRYHRGV